MLQGSAPVGPGAASPGGAGVRSHGFLGGRGSADARLFVMVF